MLSCNFILCADLCDRYGKDTEKSHSKDPSCCPIIAKATSFPSSALLPGDHSSVLISIIVSCQEHSINRLTQHVYPLRLVFFPLIIIPLGSFLAVWLPMLGSSFYYQVEFQSMATPPLFNHSPVRDILVVPTWGLLQRNGPPTLCSFECAKAFSFLWDEGPRMPHLGRMVSTCSVL